MNLKTTRKYGILIDDGDTGASSGHLEVVLVVMSDGFYGCGLCYVYYGMDLYLYVMYYLR